MPAEWKDELLALGSAAGTVAGLALPVGILAWIGAKQVCAPILPKWMPPTPRWTGLEAILLFAAFNILPTLVVAGLTQVGFYSSVLLQHVVSHEKVLAFVGVAGGSAATIDPAESQTPMRKVMWAGFLAVPLLLLLGRTIRMAVGKDDPIVASVPSRLPANVALAVAFWFALTPIVFGVNILANWVVTQTGDLPDRHPLVFAGTADRTIDLLVFLLSTCVLVPLAEEFVFRGVLIPWATRKSYGPVVILAVAGLFVANDSIGHAGLRVPPLMFVAILGIGLVLLYQWSKSRPRFPIRTVAAVYSTAAFFASVHSGVWPSPVPLFFLGLGLGYLVARTRSILPAVVVHGLFNAISAILVLRGETGG